MNSRHLRIASIVLALALGSSCSKVQQSGGENQPRNQGSSPDIAPSAAPGVAFSYDYRFSLPDQKIAAAQEAHASACEKLGLGRCRITGMTYDVDQDEQVTADLELKLDPAIARAFGKSAQELVEGNDGKLVRLQIGSSNEGEAISSLTRQRSQNDSQIAQLEKELAKTKPGTQARAALLNELQSLQGQSSRQSQAIENSEENLATTPMAFRYYGRGGVPGFRANPVHEAWLTFVTTIVWLVGILLQGLAVLIPVLALVAAILAVWRMRAMRVVRQWVRSPKELEA